MSMFDYDTRPITPQVVLVGNRASSAGYTIRDFLSRNGVPYDWVDIEDVERLPAVISPSEMDPVRLPICILRTERGLLQPRWSELATRATAQARRFGAEILLARRLVDLSRDGPGYLARLSDGTVVRARATLLASGADWRRLDIPGLDDLLGSGVYYGAGPSEAVTCTGCRVAVIGGGNSAGQAVVRFSRYAAHVTLLVRGSSLEASMSQYLITQVGKLPNVEVRTNTEVVEL